MLARGVVFAILLGSVASAAQTAPAIRPYLEVNGKEIDAATVKIDRTASQIKATFRAPADGVYSFGLSVSAEQLALLGLGKKSYTCASLTQPLTLRYPYDWTARDRAGNILGTSPRLVMPGIEAGGQVYLVDTHELFSVKVACEDGHARAVLLAHRFFNDGGDRATPELRLHAGETRELVVRLYKDIAQVNRDRVGEHQPMKGNMAGLFFIESDQDTGRENDGFFGTMRENHCCRSFTPQEWETAARKLEGTFQYALIRDKISNAIAPPFHRHGVKVYHYQYLGAWRRRSADVTPEIEKDYGLRDANGQLYMAPRPDGVFLLVDIRRPEVRARLVKDARDAVHAGMDGVFLDGWPFWADTKGDVGGNVPSATESWAYARWQLLEETRAAIHAENPKATLGLLTNHYFDSLGIADWMMKEFVYGAWYSVERASGNDAVGHYQPATGSRVRKDKDRDFEEQEAPYIAGPIAYGAKGFSPIAVQSSLHFILRPSGLYYTDEGQFPAADLEKYLDTLVGVFKPTDLYLSDIDPASCWIRFEGATTMVSEGRCTVRFSRPMCVSELPDGKPAGAIQSLALKPEVHYKVTRECEGQK